MKNTLIGKLKCTSTPNDEVFLMCCIQNIQIEHSIIASYDEPLNDFHDPASLPYHLKLEIFNLSLNYSSYIHCPTSITFSHSSCTHIISVVAKLAERHWSSYVSHLIHPKNIYGYETQCLLVLEPLQGWLTVVSHLNFPFKLEF